MFKIKEYSYCTYAASWLKCDYLHNSGYISSINAQHSNTTRPVRSITGRGIIREAFLLKVTNCLLGIQSSTHVPTFYKKLLLPWSRSAAASVYIYQHHDPGDCCFLSHWYENFRSNFYSGFQ